MSTDALGNFCFKSWLENLFHWFKNVFQNYRPPQFLIERSEHGLRDLLFGGLLILCIVFALGSVASNLEKQESGATQRGARKVDAAKIRMQILDGSLSPRKALYYRRISR